jgi:hypothetical protein
MCDMGSFLPLYPSIIPKFDDVMRIDLSLCQSLEPDCCEVADLMLSLFFRVYSLIAASISVSVEFSRGSYLNSISIITSF